MTELTGQTPSAPPGAIPQKTGWLRPPWRPGQSGNPSGKAKDGGGSKDHPIRATLRKRLAKRRALERLVDTWIDAACEGDSAAREQILKRLDPVLDDSQAGRQILTGLKLELQVGKGPITHVRGLVGQAELPAGELRVLPSVGVPEGGAASSQIPADSQIHQAPQIQESQSLSEGTQVPSSLGAAADPSSGS